MASSTDYALWADALESLLVTERQEAGEAGEANLGFRVKNSELRC